MIIFRTGSKDKWHYEDQKGNVIKDKSTLEYIKKLAIPPAYKDVQIFYENGKEPKKMLFLGYDDKGRLQQIYSKKWREKADKEKFRALIDFGRKLPQINLKLIENIKSQETSKFKDKLISIILRITALCGFRIGQLKYHKLYNSTGLSTLQKKHLNFTNKGLEIKFIGKKGVLNECIVEDKLVIGEMLKLSKDKAKDDFIFSYQDANEIKIITAIDVNNWLKEYNPDFTTKFFRTFSVNDMLIDFLKQTDPTKLTQNQRKKKIVELIKDISCSINNTPAICKKSYINNELINLYIEHPKKYSKQLIENNNSSHVNFINFLESIYL